MFCPWRSRQAHADYMLSCLLTKHFLTLGQSTAWHPDEVLRYIPMKHCMGIRKKDGPVPSRNCPAFARNIYVFFQKIRPSASHDSAEAGGQAGKATRKKVSRFRLHGFTGRQTSVNERDSVKDGVKAWKLFHGEWKNRRTFVCDAPNGLFPAFTVTRLQSDRSGETSPGHIPCFRWKV